MSLELTPTGGRYPGGRILYEAANIRATMEQREDRITIRVEDNSHSDRWETFSIPTRTLLAALLRPRSEDGDNELLEE